MSEEELSEYAATFHGALFHKPEEGRCHPEVVIVHGGTHVDCWFIDGRLEVIQVDWISRPMYVTIEPKRYLCEGEASWTGRPKVGCELN